MKKNLSFYQFIKSFLSVFMVCSFLLLCFSASGQDIDDNTPWIWKGGDSTANQLGHYGTKGVPDVHNIPTARTQAASWTDNSGNFWLFGGRMAGSGPSGTVLNDLWRYSPFTQEWTWISGDSTFNGNAVIGTPGVPSTTNTPSARSLTGHWKDHEGNLWLFAGVNMIGRYNDLWKFDPVNLTWTFLKGDSLLLDVQGVYGTLGTGHIDNKPGSRSACSGWADDMGNLWIFGGQGLSSTSTFVLGLSDLWKYHIASNTWTWVGGSNLSNASNQLATYGTKTVESATNYPGGRAWSVTWVDGTGNFWMMGGLGYGMTTSNGVLNDLWKYNPLTNIWTWMSGANVVNHQGTYISKGVSSADRLPRCRFASTAWVDKGGDLWMFGGITINWQSAYINDIWRYNIATNEWTWVKGDSVNNVLPQYNVLNVPNMANEIGARGVEISWRENANNNVWIFGGQNMVASSIQTHNDLWKIEACSPIGMVNEITGMDTVCAGDSVSFSVIVASGNTYLWDFPSSWGSQQNGNTITVLPDSNGVISVRVIGNCGDTSNLQSKEITIQSIDLPVISEDRQNGVTTLSVPNIYATYQWSKDGLSILGAASSSYIASENGYYTVEVTSAFGCTRTSESFHLTDVTSIGNLEKIAGISHYPNPVKDVVFLNIQINAKIKLVDLQGRVLITKEMTKGQNSVDFSNLSSGLYFMEFKTEEGVYICTLKLVKE